jgi:hypothetical protein
MQLLMCSNWLYGMFVFLLDRRSAAPNDISASLLQHPFSPTTFRPVLVAFVWRGLRIWVLDPVPQSTKQRQTIQFPRQY